MTLKKSPTRFLFLSFACNQLPVKLKLVGSPSSTGIASIDDLAEDGPPLVIATYGLVAPLFHEFGLPEPMQITRDGKIRLSAWVATRYRVQYQVWAEESGVDIIQD